MGKILLTGVRGNFGRTCAAQLLELCPPESLVFASSSAEGLGAYAEAGVETRIANFNEPDGLARAFSGADTAILISVPFVGPRRRAAHKAAVDAAVIAGVDKIVYTSSAGAGSEGLSAKAR